MKKNYVLLVSMMALNSAALMGCSTDNTLSSGEMISKAVEEHKQIDAYYAEGKMTVYENDELVEESRVKEWRDQQGARTRMEVTSNVENVYSVNDGQSFTFYIEGEDTAWTADDPELASVPERNQKDELMNILDMIQQTHHVSLVGEESVNGFDTYHLQAEAKDNQSLFGDQEYWIDQQTWFVIKNISLTGNAKMELEYTQVDFSPEITDDLFVLDLPQDVEVKNFSELDPTRNVTLEEAQELVGEAFLHFPEDQQIQLERIEAVEVNMDIAQRNEVNLYYQKEGVPFFMLSVFATPAEEGDFQFPGEEEITLRGQEATYMEDVIRSVMWDEDGFRYSLILTDPGLQVEEIQEMAENMIKGTGE